MALVIGAYYYQYLSRAYRVVLLLALIALVSEVAGQYIRHNLHEHNVWLFNLYMPLEPLFLGVVSIDLVGSRFYKKLVYCFIILNFIIWGIELYRNSLDSFASFSMICGCFLLVGIYTYTLFFISMHNNSTLIKIPSFWLCLSVILYFGCDIPYMGMFRYWPTYKTAIIKFSNINQLLNFIRYPLVAICFIMAGNQKRLELKKSIRV